MTPTSIFAIEGGLLGARFWHHRPRCTATSRIIIQRKESTASSSRALCSTLPKALKVAMVWMKYRHGPSDQCTASFGTDPNYVEVGPLEGAKLKCGWK